MPAEQAPVIVGETPPAPPPPPKAEIHVSAPVESPPIDKGPAQPPPRPGSARERLFDDLRKKAKVSSTDSRLANAEATPGTPTGVSPEGAAAPVSAAPSPKTGEPAAAPSPEPDKKKNPWKVVDEWKGKYAALESEYAKARQSSLAEQERKDYQTKLAEIQKRADDLETEIRFVNYEKSSEYQTKYEEPYKKAWGRAAKELSEIPVKLGDGTERTASIQDLAEIVNMPLGRARAVADEAFGPFADDIMGYRKEILGLLDAKNAALDDAKKNSIQRDKELAAQQQGQLSEIGKTIKETWDKVNEEFMKDETYGPVFRPIEGDQEGNARLAKGYELVDRAFSENPNNPKLTPEERAKIVRRHAAVRNRAASWGRLHANYAKATAEVEALKKELAQYKGSVPNTAGRQPAGAAAPSSARESVFGALRKLAKPA